MPKSSLRSRRGVVRALFACSLLLVAPASGAGSAVHPDGRLVVLGFDGADARTVEAMMAKGELPNLKRLAEQGTFAPLSTTNPAESPVSWSALNSGQNPAKTAIPGFVKRVLRKGQPFPTKGFALDEQPIAVETLSGAPIPTWSPLVFGLALGGLALIVFAVVFGLLLRLKRAPTAILSILLAAAGVWGGIAVRGYLPPTIPVVKNPLEAAPFWEVAARAGVKCVVLDGAQAWDREPIEGARVLAGLGVPDARGDYMSYFIYTTDESVFARALKDSGTATGGNKLRVDEKDGAIRGEIYGPINFWSTAKLQAELDEINQERERNPSYKKSLELNEREGELKKSLSTAQANPLTLPLVVERAGTKAKVTLGTQTQELGEGEWSDWYHLTFELNPLLKAHAVTRAKVISLEKPHFELFVNAIEIDPAAPPFWQPISQPADFAPSLASRSGTFETLGWACITHPFKDGIIDPVTFMQDVEFTEAWRARLTYDALERDDWQVLMSCMSTPDRVQHMMYQFYDREHPSYDAARAAQTMTFGGEEIALSDAIPAVYRQTDRIVGEVMKRLKPEDTLIVCADHGFQSFRREVWVNNWLAEKGYLALKDTLTSTAQSRMVGDYVDWSKTRAYSMGLGSVYLNLKGREANGIVEPSEKDALLRQMRADFVASTDGPTGPRFGREAWLTSEIHSGPHLDQEADLMLGFDAGYRVSWSTTLGGINLKKDENGKVVLGDVCTENAKNWSGDHVSVDPSLVRGIFFANRKVKLPEGGVDLLHIAPTALALLGVPVPAECDKPPLELEP